MDLRVGYLREKLVVGMKSKMQQLQYQNIVALWKQFMPRQTQIKNRLTQEFIALQNYSDFGNSTDNFEFWACVEASNSSFLPEGMWFMKIP